MRAITYSVTALKDLKAIDKPQRKKIVAKIEQYAATPGASANQIKKLQGSGLLRLRVGDYRVIFTEDALVVAVIAVGNRRDVYG